MKKNTIMYIIITILLIMIAIGVTYIIMNNKNNEEEILEDNVTLKNTTTNNDTIIQEYEVIMNNKVNNFEITYTYQKDEGYSQSETHEIIGNFNNMVLVQNYYVNIGQVLYTKENTFNISNINNIFDEDNFTIIKGTDNKSYLLVQTVNEMTDNFNTSNLYVYNDELELISKNIISAEESPDYTSYDGFVIDNFLGNMPCDYANNSPLYERTFKIISDANETNKQYTKIENNQIYFLFPKINENYNGGILEERVYTINNNKLEYTVANTYKFSSVCQQI